jgi:phosphatidylserine decarboxylase
MSRLEITSMLDSLGSTLSGETIDAFFSSRGKDTQTDELTIGDVVQSIETELFRPTKERKRLDAADYNHAMDLTTPNTPALGGFGAAGGDPFGQLDFAGPPGHIPPEEAPGEDFADRVPPPAYPTESNQQELADTLSYGPNTLTAPVPSGQGVRPMYPPHLSSSSATSEVDGEESPSGSTSPGGAAVERVINVKTCPLCHRPRLGSKGEVDIVTHLAICASQDWERVDKIVVGNFVTSSQAQRKWMMKLIGKVSNGAYRLGAVRRSAMGCSIFH